MIRNEGKYGNPPADSQNQISGNSNPSKTKVGIQENSSGSSKRFFTYISPYYADRRVLKWLVQGCWEAIVSYIILYKICGGTVFGDSLSNPGGSMEQQRWFYFVIVVL